MSAIPSNYPADTLSAVSRVKLEWFCRRYTENFYDEYRFGHFLLAAYAAVPALLTPDLLYKIWQNFNSYKWNDVPAVIHRVAVADTLLSPFCQETGFELYEMDQDIKLAFLDWLRIIEEDKQTLWKDRGIYTIEAIANFVHEYHLASNTGATRWGSTYTEAQELEALSYTDPGKVANILFNKLKEQSVQQQETELLRTMDLFVKTNNRLERVFHNDKPGLNNFRANVKSIIAFRDLFQQNNDSFLEQLDVNNSLTQFLFEKESSGGIRLDIPQTTAEKVDETKKLQPPKLRALIVGIHSVNPETPVRYGTLEGENDAQRMVDFVQTFFSPEESEVTLLLGPQATKAGILQALAALAETSTQADNIVFYVSANATRQEGHCHMVCYDSINLEAEGSAATLLSDTEFNAATANIRRNSFVAILELPYSGTRYWLDTDKGKNNLVFACCAHDQVPRYKVDMLLEGKQQSFFTHVLVNEWRMAETYISYRHLFKRAVKSFENLPAVKTVYGVEQRMLHRPQMYCSPEMLNQVLPPAARTEARVQTLLRQTGVTDARTTGTMDQSNEALALYCVNEGISIERPIEELIRHMEDRLEKQAAEGTPLCLLIFSDPDKSLRDIDSEKRKLASILRAGAIEYIQLVDPDKNLLEKYIRDSNNRNMIKVVYYSGTDDGGDLELSDTVLRVSGVTELLDFQESIELFVANTARSKYLAETISQQGIKMSIGVERNVTERDAAEFGQLLFEWLTKQNDLNKFAEYYRTFFQARSEVYNDLAPYQVLTAPWADEKEVFTISLTGKGKRAGGAAQTLKKVYTLSIGLGPVVNAKEFAYCVPNSNRFKTFLEQVCPVLKREFHAVDVGNGGVVGRSELEQALQSFEEARSGDTCVIFYSGALAVNNNHEYDIILVTDRNNEDRTLWEMLAGLEIRDNVHLLVIVDAHNSYSASRSMSKYINTGFKGGITVLQNCQDKDLLAIANWKTDNNHFFNSFIDLLQEGGYRLSYDNLFFRLKLRLTQLGLSIPAITHSGNFDTDNPGSKRFITGEITRLSYSISYDKEKESWIVNAGSRQGIRPSLDFMQTIFETDNNTRLTVKEVYPDHSTLSPFNAPDNKSYEARLIQNALPKVKIAYAPDMDNEMKAGIERAIANYKIYYIDIIDNTAEAAFIIAHHEDSYLLIRREDLQQKSSERKPIFDYRYEPFQFIKQIEYIAQWQGLLELDNPETRLEKDSVWFSFEKIEGDTGGKGKIDLRKPVLIPDPDPVELNYTLIDEQGRSRWREPQMRCKVTRVKKPVYVSVLYLGAMYEIMEIEEFICKPGEEKYVQFGSRDTATISINRHYLEKGITEVYDYIKFFVSENPMNIKALEQEQLRPGYEITRSIEMGKDNRPLDTTGSDWTVVTIPIKITQKPPAEEKAFIKENIYKPAHNGDVDPKMVAIARTDLINNFENAIRNHQVVVLSGSHRVGKTTIAMAGFARLKITSFRFSMNATNINSDKIIAELMKPGTGSEYVFIDDYESIQHLDQQRFRDIENTLNELAGRHKIIIAIDSNAELRLKYSLLVGTKSKRNSMQVERLKRSDGYRMVIPPWSPRELRQLIKAPHILPESQRFKEEVEIKMAEDAMSFEQPVMALLPVLSNIFEKQQGDLNNFTLADYQSMGGLGTKTRGVDLRPFREKVEELYRNKPVTVADDLQKGRWGGQPSANGKKLSVEIFPTEISHLYRLNIIIENESHAPPPEGQAAVFLHNTFETQILYGRFTEGVAQFELNGVYEAFTIGAYTEDATMLELDLDEQKGFPEDFYYETIPDTFRIKMQDIHNATGIMVPGDLQKGRWSGTPAANGKKLSATVQQSGFDGFYSVILRVSANGDNPPISGNVAFFLHDTYSDPIVYKKAVNGEAAITIMAYGAFTVGACTADGSFLELDLDTLENAPEDFYFISRRSPS